jgi:OCT family organic cation transporter-like MFS transporter 4/5
MVYYTGVAPQQPPPTPCGGTLVDVIRSPTTRWRLIIMSVIWFCTTIVYYGLNFNIVNMGFNIYMGVFINGAIELPAYFITALLLGKVGRRRLLSSALVLTGVSCLVGSLLFDNTTTSMTSALASTTTIDNLSFTTLYLGISSKSSATSLPFYRKLFTSC